MSGTSTQRGRRIDVESTPTRDAIEVDRHGLQVLDRGECLRLLASTTFGRLGLTSGALPTVLPINYRLVGDRIVFRTGQGSKLEAATHNQVVAFEIDAMDPLCHTGWSVVVTGTAREVTDPVDLETLAAAGLPRWLPSDNGSIVEIPTTLVTGRRILGAGSRPAR